MGHSRRAALYASSTAAWGFTPLEDQQLAGLIMWVPTELAYLSAALAIAASWLKEPGAKTDFAALTP